MGWIFLGKGLGVPFRMGASGGRSSYWSSHLFGEDDIDFHAKSRSELSLIDDKGNDATILPFVYQSHNDTPGNSLAFVTTDIIVTEKTLWVFRAKSNAALFDTNTLLGGVIIANTYFLVRRASKSPFEKYELLWGNTIGRGTLTFDMAWHTFIVYDKRLWVLPVDTSLTDANILNIISTVTPDVNLSGAAWTQNENVFKYFKPLGATGSLCNATLSYLGSITDSVITWDAKHIFTSLYYVYDILGVKHYPIVGTAAPYVYGKAVFEAEGDQSGLNTGYSEYYKEGAIPLQVPYKEDGTPQVSPTVPSGYVFNKNQAGSATTHNLANSMIEFTGDIFDRSNDTIYKDAARAATTFYNAAAPKRWHVTEINRLLINDWLNDDYLGRWFPKFDPNSIDLEARASILELFSYATNVTGDDFNKVIRYTGDYDLIVI